MDLDGTYPRMHNILKPVEGKEFAIHHFEITKEKLKFEKLRDLIKGNMEMYGQEDGTFVRLVHLPTKEVVMSDTWMERYTNEGFVRRANGNILIAGLGLGLIVLAVQNFANVKSITIIEKSKEVIELVAPQLPLNEKVKIIEGDIFNFVPSMKYDIIYFDIWNKILGDNYEEMKNLHKKYSRYLNRSNPSCWMKSWRVEDCRKRYLEK